MLEAETGDNVESKGFFWAVWKADLEGKNVGKRTRIRVVLCFGNVMYKYQTM